MGKPKPQTARRADFLSEVKAYCEAAKIKPTTLGIKVVGNSRFVERYERAEAKRLEDEAAIRRFMADNPPKNRQADSADA